MKRYIKILFVLIFCGSISLYSQAKMNNKNAFERVGQEKIFVHFNTSFLLVGERLYYKVYCLNSKTNKLTNLSKIAYVALIGNDNEVIFKHKIRLDAGTGQGDFFIPTSVSSGNYKLIAYSRWMMNGGENNFFQNDIFIINPFNEIKNENLSNINATDTIQESQKKDLLGDNREVVGNNNNEFIQLKLEKKEVGKREKVSLIIKSLKDKESYGNYSISVREIYGIKEPEKLKTTNYFSLFSENANFKISDSIFLPEYRGELLSGKVIFKDSNKIASNLIVALSIPGKDYIFKIANTNNQGEFYFNIAEEYKNSGAIIQLINSDEKDLEIILDDQATFKAIDLKFNTFLISQTLNDIILKRSINNQIENAYENVKKDTIIDPVNSARFFGNNIKEYDLNDYTRFPTLKETFVEIVDLVYTIRKNGVNTLNVIGTKEKYDSGLLPLVLMDGVLIQDIDELLNFNAEKVKKINVLAERYIYGSHLFKGVVSLETNNGDYRNSFSNNTIKNIELFKSVPNKNYFNQIYDGSKIFDRIPDYRNQLLWMPNLVLDTLDKEVTFYTSDTIGKFEISIEGFTNEGIPISLKEVFSVEN